MEEGVSAVRVSDLWKIYKSGSQEVPALRGLSMEVAPGKFTALKGRSGSGKTTLLNCLSGLDEPTSGQVFIFGKDLSEMNESQKTRWRSKELGLVFQSFGLIPTLSAYENIEIMLRLSGVKARERKRRTRECLELVGLAKWADHRPFEMSGGQQQRVAVARSIANRPQLILADEPTGELDTTTAREIMDLFRKIVDEQRVTLLITSHDPVVDNFVDRILYLKDGMLVEPEPA
jgi:ABC-type lipoprotein export system ATPase subunit